MESCFASYFFNSQALIEFYACLLRRMEGDRSEWTNIHIYSANDDDFYLNRFPLFGNRMRAATNLFVFLFRFCLFYKKCRMKKKAMEKTKTWPQKVKENVYTRINVYILIEFGLRAR